MYKFILLSSFALFGSGCAFMFNGGKQDVSFTANPSDADIRNNGRFLGTGTATASLDRNTSQNITVSREGYDDAHVYAAKKLNAGWAFWDIGTCVIPVALCIPVLVDAISGAWNGYDDHFAVKLIKSQPKPVAPPPAPIKVVEPPPAVQPAPGQQIFIIK